MGRADGAKEWSGKGARNGPGVIIEIDAEGAHKEEGIKFYMSKNGVVLTPGNERRIIPARYLKIIKYEGGGKRGLLEDCQR